MTMLTLKPDFASAVRPARTAGSRGLWAKDPSSPLADDGTRLDATFVNDLLGLLRATVSAFGVAADEGDDTLIAQAISSAIAAVVASYAPLNSPPLVGTPTAPTADLGTNSQQIATTAFVAAAVAAIVNSSPSTLDTLKELADALGDDPNFATTITTLIGTKLAKSANLSDLADVVAARGNLGLGALAILNTVTASLISDAGATGRSILQAANVAAVKTLLAYQYSDLTGTPTIAADGVVAQNVSASAHAAQDGMVNGQIVASVASNALTFAVKTLAGTDPSATDPVDFFFRSTVTSGNFVRRRVTSALAITVPQGQAIGAPSGQGFAFYLEAIDNAGTVELAVFNPVVGGSSPSRIVCPSEGQLISTTAIASAPNGGVHYSAAARANVAFRTICRAEYASLTTAGTWASVPTNLDLIKPWSKKPGDVVQSRATAGSAFSTTSTSQVATNLSLAITPTSPASLVRIKLSGGLQITGANTFGIQMYRGATPVGPALVGYVNSSATINQFNAPASAEALDAPGTTSATTYTEKIQLSGGTGTTGGANDWLFLDEVWV